MKKELCIGLVSFLLLSLPKAGHAASGCSAVDHQFAQAASENSGSAFALGFTPDSKKLLAANSDGSLRVFDVATGKPERSLGTDSDMLWSMQFSKDGSKIVLAGGGDDAAVVVVDAKEWKVIHRFKNENKKNPYTAEFSADASRILITENPSAIRHIARVIDANSGDSISAAEFSFPLRVAHFSGDGHYITILTEKNLLHVGDATSGATIYELKGITGMELANNKTLMLVVWVDNTVELLDIGNGGKTRTFPVLTKYASLSDNGKTMVTGQIQFYVKLSDGHTVRFQADVVVRDRDSGSELKTDTTQFELKNGVGPATPTLSPDGRFVMLGSGDPTHVRLAQLDNAACAEVLLANTEDFYGTAISPDSKAVVLGLGSKNLQIVTLK